MQKKIIALAVAGLVSGAAFAQSNVTVYGVADISDVYASDSYKANTKSTNMISSGGASLNGSRFGFKGVEDLGNGMSAKFRMEGGIVLDTGVSDQGGALMGRWSTVGLAGKNWGEIEAGRRDTFSYQLLAATTGNGLGTIAQISPVYNYQTRINNFVAYTSPSWSGFVVKAGFATQGTDTTEPKQDVAPTEIALASENTAANTNLRVYTAAVHYVNGPLTLGAAADYNRLQDRDSSVAGNAGDGSYNSGNLWNIAGAYDFGMVRVDAGYGMINYADNTQPLINEKKDTRTQWTLGAVVPFGAKDRVMVNYAHANISYLNSATNDDSIALWGVNYMHDFSKRTVLYASFAKISQDDDVTTKATVNGMPTGSGYQQGVQIGLRHSF